MHPIAPDEVIRRIHRGPDSFLNVTGKPNGEWAEYATVPAAELFRPDGILSRIGNHDVYFSHSSVYRSERSRMPSPLEGYELYSRTKLTWLNCIALDIDAGHTEGQPFDCDRAIQEALRYTVNSGIPLPSMVSRSGRGFWFFWLLRDRQHEHEPLGAFKNLRAITQRVSKAAIAHYKHLGADPKCNDSQRVTRIPGTINSKTGSTVQFYLITDQVFTLPEIANAFGVEARKTELVERKASGKSSQHVNAGIQRWRLPLAGLNTLAQMRGKFKTGTRHHACYLYAVLCCRTKTADIHSAVQQFVNRHCPGLNVRDASKAIHAARKSYLPIRNTTFIETLQISDRERELLSFWLKLPKTPATSKAAYRRKLLTAEIELACAGAAQLSVRELQALLKAKHNLRVSHTTVIRDLRVLEANANRPPEALRRRAALFSISKPQAKSGTFFALTSTPHTGTSVKNVPTGKMPPASAKAAAGGA